MCSSHGKSLSDGHGLSSRPVHGSVRFEPQKPTEPSNSHFLKFKLNQTKFWFKPNRFGSIKFGFIAKNWKI
jgi:hypothetical protein